MSDNTITIDVVSDVVCPWCYIGQKRLEAAVASAPEIDVDIRWRPYQLDPTIPAQGVDRQEYMLAKFGSIEKLRAIHDKIVPLGQAEGIDFRFDDIKVAVNTLDAHRVIRWAATAGNDVQHRVAKGLFAANFEDGENISDHDTLARIAGENGMEEPVVRALLAGEADKDAVEAEIDQARSMGVTGVPCFVIEGRYAVVGAQDADALADAIRQVAAAKARGELNGAE